MWLLESLNNARQAAREAGVSEAAAGLASLDMGAAGGK